jgi:hypothetical protein
VTTASILTTSSMIAQARPAEGRGRSHRRDPQPSEEVERR